MEKSNSIFKDIISKIRLTNSTGAWVWLGCFFLAPILLVRLFDDYEIFIRFIATGFLLFTFLMLLLFFLISPKFLFPFTPYYQRKIGEKKIKIINLGFKFFFLIFAISILYYDIIPLSIGAVRFIVQKESLQTIEAQAKTNDSSFLPGSAIIGRSLIIDNYNNGQSYIFMYPNPVSISLTSMYRFYILPGSEFILKTEKIE